MNHKPEEWKAQWIWSESEDVRERSEEHEIVYFRRCFEVAEPAASRLVVHVSADSRYRLYLNGQSVSVGPCKGDRFTRYFETVDITDKLVEGMNVLAAKVVHYRSCEPFRLGIGGPASVWRSGQGVFLLEGNLTTKNGSATIDLSTDNRWECLRDAATRFVAGGQDTLYVGGTEQTDGRLLPFGWLKMRDKAQGWRPAVMVSEIIDVLYGQLTPWPLEARAIPPLYEIENGYVGVKRILPSNALPDFYLLDGDSNGSGWLVRAGETLEVELDAGGLTTGYPYLDLTGGRGTTVEILYSECYEREAESTIRRNKDIRDDPEGRYLYGEFDRYIVAGQGETDKENYERYEPFEFRTFRYVRLTVRAGEEDVRLHRFNYCETGYPLEVKAYFASSDPTLLPLWEISINTLRRCMHETYEDCPYYEQLQYIMDTRLQVLFTYQISADDRLARKAIFDFHSSLMPNGMIQSRYPSVYPQVIPGFSIYWIMMVADHYRYFGDAELVRRYLPTIDAVLHWFAQHVEASGLMGAMPQSVWSFVDWVEEWRGGRGVPTANEYGPLTAYSLFYVLALQTAAELNEVCGRHSTAEEYMNRAAAVQEAVRSNCWSAERRLFADGPTVQLYSQHCQIFAVLTRTVPDGQAGELLSHMLEQRDLPTVSYAMSFYLFRALEKAGLYDKSYRLWDTWRDLAAMNLTSWVEDPVSQRSDCHGWGSVPLYEFTACVLGVSPMEPGSRGILIRPDTSYLEWAEGAVATADGVVHVSWRRREDGTIACQIDCPEQISARLELPDGRVVELAQGGRVSI
ncbi:hypothetical protein B1748_00090 [Paenibacillus sp. MY03]|uniref:family 78 glycoside hydrolase catalytic domain n=1 Tax=Paenibacillus sp. MY03 TaxID=302980 RepID=UPI000B3C6972|nr:family 78 glycoside hydrolase catalytic domain [Paenibacillus sp. MY03]OUS78515.1 hypothetical protein B1748_00090 [Paenibacillus sp. MY03]